MLNKEELKEKIKELEEKIADSESEIRDLESQIEDLEFDLDCERDTLSDLENELSYCEKQLLALQTPREQISYWLRYVHDSCRPALDGQFERNGKWYICNGYVLLELNEKADDLQICEGMDNLPSLLEKEKTLIDVDIEKYDNNYIGEKISLSKDLTVNGEYLVACSNILQLNSKSKFYSTEGQSTVQGKNFVCENENGRALILGIRGI